MAAQGVDRRRSGIHGISRPVRLAMEGEGEAWWVHREILEGFYFAGRARRTASTGFRRANELMTSARKERGRGVKMRPHTLIHEKSKTFFLEYAGIDMIEKALSYEFETSAIDQSLALFSHECHKHPYVEPDETWEFHFTVPCYDIPQEGEVKLFGITPGPGDDFCAEGTATITKTKHVVDLEAGTIEATLMPVNAPLRFPAREQRRAGIVTEKEQLRKQQELERERKMAAWRDVGGVWTVKGVRYDARYTETHASMSEAILSAVGAVEWNQAAPRSIWQNDRQIFDREDIIALMDYGEGS